MTNSLNDTALKKELLSAESILVEHLTGCDESFLVNCGGCQLHGHIVDDWQRLVSRASESGIDLSVASAYRSFDRQLTIWNEKVRGVRPVFDGDGNVIEVSALTEDELMFAIMRWSALPGASRHHWGTDLDVFDAAAMPEGYKLQLNNAEALEGGVFADLHSWLEEAIAGNQSFNFFRPYTNVLSNNERGVSAEWWHLSHRKVSEIYERRLIKKRLYSFYEGNETILLKKSILNNFDCIFENFIQR